MKAKDQIEFLKGLISAHFDKGYRLLQVKDTNEHNAKREKQNQTRQVRIVMGVLAFICLSFGTRGFFHLEEYQYFLGTNALPADAKLIASGLTVFGIIFALIGLDPQLAIIPNNSILVCNLKAAQPTKQSLIRFCHRLTQQKII